MENTQHFGQLTERMKAFREEVLDEKPYVDGATCDGACKNVEEDS